MAAYLFSEGGCALPPDHSHMVLHAVDMCSLFIPAEHTSNAQFVYGYRNDARKLVDFFYYLMFTQNMISEISSNKKTWVENILSARWQLETSLTLVEQTPQVIFDDDTPVKPPPKRQRVACTFELEMLHTLNALGDAPVITTRNQQPRIEWVAMAVDLYSAEEAFIGTLHIGVNVGNTVFSFGYSAAEMMCNLFIAENDSPVLRAKWRSLLGPFVNLQNIFVHMMTDANQRQARVRSNGLCLPCTLRSITGVRVLTQIYRNVTGISLDHLDFRALWGAGGIFSRLTTWAALERAGCPAQILPMLGHTNGVWSMDQSILLKDTMFMTHPPLDISSVLRYQSSVIMHAYVYRKHPAFVHAVRSNSSIAEYLEMLGPDQQHGITRTLNVLNSFQKKDDGVWLPGRLESVPRTNLAIDTVLSPEASITLHGKRPGDLEYISRLACSMIIRLNEIPLPEEIVNLVQCVANTFDLDRQSTLFTDAHKIVLEKILDVTAGKIVTCPWVMPSVGNMHLSYLSTFTLGFFFQCGNVLGLKPNARLLTFYIYLQTMFIPSFYFNVIAQGEVGCGKSLAAREGHKCAEENLCQGQNNSTTASLFDGIDKTNGAISYHLSLVFLDEIGGSGWVSLDKLNNTSGNYTKIILSEHAISRTISGRRGKMRETHKYNLAAQINFSGLTNHDSLQYVDEGIPDRCIIFHINDGAVNEAPMWEAIRTRERQISSSEIRFNEDVIEAFMDPCLLRDNFYKFTRAQQHPLLIAGEIYRTLLQMKDKFEEIDVLLPNDAIVTPIWNLMLEIISDFGEITHNRQYTAVCELSRWFAIQESVFALLHSSSGRSLVLLDFLKAIAFSVVTEEHCLLALCMCMHPDLSRFIGFADCCYNYIFRNCKNPEADLFAPVAGTRQHADDAGAAPPPTEFNRKRFQVNVFSGINSLHQVATALHSCRSRDNLISRKAIEFILECRKDMLVNDMEIELHPTREGMKIVKKNRYDLGERAVLMTSGTSDIQRARNYKATFTISSTVALHYATLHDTLTALRKGGDALHCFRVCGGIMAILMDRMAWENAEECEIVFPIEGEDCEPRGHFPSHARLCRDDVHTHNVYTDFMRRRVHENETYEKNMLWKRRMLLASKFPHTNWDSIPWLEDGIKKHLNYSEAADTTWDDWKSLYALHN